MGAPTILRWDDVDAPVLDGLEGSLINLLGKCLVTGYGSESPLGWTQEFINAEETIACYRSSLTGTGMFYRFQDDETLDVTYGGKACQVTGYESMSDVDTGAGPFPASGNLWLPKSNSKTAAARAWVIVGDEKGFYFIVWTANDTVTPEENLGRIFYIGDFISIIPGDSFAAVMIMPSHATSWEGVGVMTSTAAGASLYAQVPRKSDGLEGAMGVSLYPGSVFGHISYMGYTSSLGHPFHGLSIISRPMVNDSVGNSFRGFLPGLYYPCHHQPFDNFEEVLEGDLTLLAFRVYLAGMGCQVMLDTDVGFRP